MRLWASDEKLPARIREIAASPDPATRTYTVKAALQGQAAASAPLGATAYVTPESAESPRAALRLPGSALWQAADGQSAVWRYDPASSAVEPLKVQVGGVQGDSVLISGGLQEGMQIVTSGVHALQPGQKVSVYKPRAAAEAAEAAETAQAQDAPPSGSPDSATAP